MQKGSLGAKKNYFHGLYKDGIRGHVQGLSGGLLKEVRGAQAD
jgi:hypothetical protein